MSVPMKHRSDGIAIERLFKPAGAQERKNFRRLPDNRCLDRRVVQEHDPFVGA
jgi:hypothetical protein